ncbi:MAG TPA: SPOR domain-containing protein [Cellulomonas sp.]|uniref:SPOR domain-containing protein n=1 Tax=Cellulomonas sp. TaxID=40001 RepID=UPI002E3255B8|nr:SPOR domain-containing protein [Cellulomonas sp.]HEX5334119.1 SPOR domain-containing protein [Cellulomonas sp.]
MTGSGQQFYYNVATHQVEEGRVSDWSNRMGPYPTREAAQKALETAAARAQKWKAEEEEEER